MATLCAALVLAACEGDGDADYGYGYVYMPQAVSTGGLDNSYAVPSGAGEFTYNFRVEEDRVKVILGVLRAGKIEDGRGFTVSVVTSEAASAAAAAQFGGEVMPASIYALPQAVAVEDGQSGATFYLSIDAAALKSGAYDGRKLVLAVGIENPSAYELAKSGTTTAVVLDVDAMKAYL